jgi:hypothetical protein
MSEKIYSLLPAKKEIWIVEGAEHGGTKGPLRDYDLFHKRVLDFFRNKFKVKMPEQLTHLILHSPAAGATQATQHTAVR